MTFRCVFDYFDLIADEQPVRVRMQRVAVPINLEERGGKYACGLPMFIRAGKLQWEYRY